MKAITCEMCGSNDLIKQDGYFVCQHCGTKYSVEEAKKLMIDGTVDVKGTVKIDKTSTVENLIYNARRMLDEEDYEGAKKYYDLILQEKAMDWEAQFYVAYCNAKLSKIKNICFSADRLNNCLDSVLKLINETVEEENKEEIVREVIEKVIDIAKSFTNYAQVSYKKMLNEQLSEKEKHDRAGDIIDIFMMCLYLLECLATKVKKIFNFNDLIGDIYLAICDIGKYEEIYRFDVVQSLLKKTRKELYFINLEYKEKIYLKLINKMNSSMFIHEYEELINEFLAMGMEYKDVKKYYNICIEKKETSVEFCVKSELSESFWALNLANKEICGKTIFFNHGYGCSKGKTSKEYNTTIELQNIKKISIATDGGMQIKYWKNSREYYEGQVAYTEKDKENIKTFVEKVKMAIKGVDSCAGEKKGGCYVATCVYGSYDCPEVWTLRRYRDNTLGSTWYGRAFIRTYYAISPTLVKWFGDTKWFKKMWKGKLDKMVKKLQENGVENTPYEDKNW